MGELLALAAALAVGWLLGRVTKKSDLVFVSEDAPRRSPLGADPRYPRLVEEDVTTDSITFETSPGHRLKLCRRCGGNCGKCGRTDVSQPPGGEAVGLGRERPRG